MENKELKQIDFKHRPYSYQRKRTLYFENIEKLYIGKGNYCRCGCGGMYYYPDNDNGKAKILDALLRFHQYSTIGKDIFSIDDYIFEIQIDKEEDIVCTIYEKQPIEEKIYHSLKKQAVYKEK